MTSAVTSQWIPTIEVVFAGGKSPKVTMVGGIVIQLLTDGCGGACCGGSVAVV